MRLTRKRNRKISKSAILVFIIFSALAYSFILVSNADVILREISNFRGSLVQNLYVEPNKEIETISLNPDFLDIHIKFKDWEKIQFQRNRALDAGYLQQTDDSFVKAQINFQGKSYKVKIRLKGDMAESHLSGSKWSFRIVVDGEDTILGMKEFSIQRPESKGYMSEWFFHLLMKSQGLISPRYEFVTVNINGEKLGVYALEEHFEKRLVENNARREGPLLRFDDTYYYDELMKQQRAGFDTYVKTNGSGSYYSFDIRPFNSGKTFKNNSLKNSFLVARTLLEGFREGRYTTSQVFDIKQLAKYFAVIDTAGALHASAVRNIRFYFNPITKKLEPIGYDAGEANAIKTISSSIYMESINSRNEHAFFQSRLFEDTEFFKAYIHEINKASNPQYLEKIIFDNSSLIERFQSIINIDYPEYVFSTDAYFSNSKYLRSVFDIQNVLSGYYKKRLDNHTLQVEIANQHQLPIEVVGYKIKNKKSISIAPIILMPKTAFEPLGFDTITLDVNNTEKLEDVFLEYRILGLSEGLQSPIVGYPRILADFSDKDIYSDVTTIDTHYLSKHGRTLKFKRGINYIHSDLIIPKGNLLVIDAGTKITLGNHSKIISYSPVKALGNIDQPIVINSNGGQGIAVIDADEPSLLEHVHLIGLSAPSDKYWSLSGGVTFYKSPVHIQHCIFNGSDSEDALNIVNSKFYLGNSQFSNIKSDALDVDFGLGTLKDIRFTNIGNDAIDVSGTTLHISNIRINSTGDKGISSGEASNVTGNNVVIGDSELGVAAKDSSTVNIAHIDITHTKVGAVAYQKKPEFGPGNIILMYANFSGVDIPWLSERDSHIIINELIRESTLKPNEKLEDSLYGIKYGKKTERISR